MSKPSCEACADLRENASEFVLRGVTSNVAKNLQNNKGFNKATSTTDCEDLNDANDCMIGFMENEIDAYEPCEWREYMHKFVSNVYEVLKAIIASICGLWKYIERIIGGDMDNIPVYKVYRHVITADKFITLSGAGVLPVNWYAGGGDWEDYGDRFRIPVSEMDTILGVICQCRVVGHKTNPQTVAVQSWEKIGSYLYVDIDGYELIYGGYDAYDLPVDVFVVGTKKI